jgi:D-alanyl-D-alanine carboxypeptidase
MCPAAQERSCPRCDYLPDHPTPSPVKHFRHRLWILALAVLVPSVAGAQSAASVMRARLAADSVAAAMLRDSVAGVVIGAFRGAEPLFMAAHGQADLQSGRPLRSDEPLPIGSITKQFVAVAVLALAEEGRLTLDDPVTRFLSELGDGFRGITIRQLLHQTSGIGRYEGAFQTGPPGSSEAVVRVIAAATKEFAPGARFAYNNANYYLLGVLIERVTDQPWHAFLRARFFGPLGMTHTGLCGDDAPDGAATGYLVFGRRVDRAAIPAVMTGAAGALCSTVTDLGVWSHALHTGTLLTPAWGRLLSTPPQLPGVQPAPYGMGAVVAHLDGNRELWHNGALTSGFSSMLAYYPDDSLTVVVLANSFPARPEPAVRAIARAWFGDARGAHIPVR